MPIFDFKCDCGNEIEKIQRVGAGVPTCSDCGGAMRRKYSPIAMVKWKGEGGFPSLRKQFKGGTTPYTNNYGAYGD